ncbi:MAG: chromate transporter [Clostridia bacterium]|nr:chromate transporter [Clostridia bacterium]
MTKFQKALKLFLVFFKIGAFTFGGGYAMIPLIQHEVTVKNKWITDDDILEIVAISESTPGPIAVNSATFVGYRVCGVWGSIAATLGVVLPSFLIMLCVFFLLDKFQEKKPVQYAFMGIRACVLALVLKALISMYKKCQKNWVSYTIIAFSVITSVVIARFVPINTFYIIIASAVFGLVTYSIARRRANK